ncbi:MAG TPA: M48 family metallopeptidase [Vicinamibacterales bacterium]|nr:M48 family metallopeptidase [Vicinamibacterales bacterium]
MQLSLPLLDSAAVQSDRVVFVRHVRARRYIMRVLPDGTVRVTLPRWGIKRDAHAFVESHREWIARQHARQWAARPALPAPMPAALERALRQRAARELPVMLFALAAQHGIAVTRVSIRNQRSRWGACSSTGTITLNWRLIQTPAFVSEYVMLHELMHRREMNHSRRFWRLVAECCPGHAEARRWLRTEGKTLWSERE